MADILGTLTGILSAAATAITGRQDTLILPAPTNGAETASRDAILTLHGRAINGESAAVTALSMLRTSGTSYERSAVEIAITDLVARRVLARVGAGGIVLAGRVEPSGAVRTATIGLILGVILLVGFLRLPRRS